MHLSPLHLLIWCSCPCHVDRWFLLALCITLGFSLFLTLLLPGHVAFEQEIQWPM